MTAGQDSIPKGAVAAIGALLALCVAGTAAVRLVKLSGPDAPVAAPPASAAIELRFSDQADGAIRVSDAATGREVARLAPDTNGFVRGVMRGMARDRISRHLGPETPFRLTRDSGGRLWLQDVATRRLIDLQAFGVDNRASFAAFLAEPGERT